MKRRIFVLGDLISLSPSKVSALIWADRKFVANRSFAFEYAFIFPIVSDSSHLCSLLSSWRRTGDIYGGIFGSCGLPKEDLCGCNPRSVIRLGWKTCYPWSGGVDSLFSSIIIKEPLGENYPDGVSLWLLPEIFFCITRLLLLQFPSNLS